MPKLPTPNPNVQIRHAQLEQLMRLQLEVDESRERALVARMRLFRTRGYPPVVDQVSKKRFFYDLDAVVRMSVAFRMVDALVPQEAAPAIIEGHWTEIRAAMGKAFRAAHTLGTEKADRATDRVILVVMPRNLASLAMPKSAEVDPAVEGSAPIQDARGFEAKVSDLSSIAADLNSAQERNELAALTLIDLQRLAGWLRNALLVTRWAGPEQFETYAA